MSTSRMFKNHLFFTVAWWLAFRMHPAHLFIGFAMGAAATAILGPLVGNKDYPRRMWGVTRASLEFIRDLTMCNLQIAWDVITPTDHYAPQMVMVPVDDLSDVEMTILSSMITLTPGTLSIDLDEARRHLIVHAMYPADLDKMPTELRRPIDLIRGVL